MVTLAIPVWPIGGSDGQPGTAVPLNQVVGGCRTAPFTNAQRQSPVTIEDPLPRRHFAPTSTHRARVTPAKRGRRGQNAAREDPTPAERRVAMTRAQRRKRVFGIDIDKSAGQPICTAAGCREAVGHREVPDETCPACGGAVRIVACHRGLCDHRPPGGECHRAGGMPVAAMPGAAPSEVVRSHIPDLFGKCGMIFWRPIRRRGGA